MRKNEKIFSARPQVQCFEKVHLKLKGAIEQYIVFLTGKRTDSEDLVQEIFIKLWINWSKIETMNDDELSNYLFITVRNNIINERRLNSRPKRNKILFLREYSKTHPDYYLHDDALVAEGLKLHQKAVDQLAKREKIVYQFHQQDYSAQEIAKLLDRSGCTVQNQLNTAYKKVKTYLNKSYGWNLEEGRKNGWKSVSLN
jgi:RNA polymerase sigma-70 factor (ECF subfamily)